MIDFGKKFLFFINKIENNTIHISEILQTPGNNSNFDFTSSQFNNLDGSAGCLNGNNNYLLNGTADTINNSSSSFYDGSGAAKYIVVVVMVYGLAIVFFIGSQVRSTKKISDEVDGVNAEKILRSMETEIFTKEVLGRKTYYFLFNLKTI